MKAEPVNSYAALEKETSPLLNGRSGTDTAQVKPR
jgi:hypothetical protein